MNKEIFLKQLQSMEPSRHFGSKRGTEENIKLKFVVPLLQALGWDLVEDMDFEHLQTDIILRDQSSKQALIVEVKAWNELVSDHLSQALEYTYKTRIPWILMTSGQQMQLYSSLLNPHELDDKALVLDISWRDLKEDTKTAWHRLESLVGKTGFLSESGQLRRILQDRLEGKSYDQAYEEFSVIAAGYKHEIKSKRLSWDQFIEIATQNHPPSEAENIIRLLNCLSEWTRLSRQFRIRYRSREIGLESIDTTGPRKKKRGLFGIYPHAGHVAFGLEDWEGFSLPGDLFERMKKFPRRGFESKEKTQELIDLMTDALKEVAR